MGACASTETQSAVPAAPDAKARVKPAVAVACEERPPGAPWVLGAPGEDVRSRYTFEKVLGKGQFGVTRLVIDKATGEQCACKSISKRKLVNDSEIEDVRKEIKILHHLSGHPHVVGFKGAYEDQYHVHLCMELCTGGELFQQVSAKGHYREKDAAQLMRTILQVVQHCHSMGVIHRDIKPENWLFSAPGRRHLKAIDFGLSSFFQEGQPLADLVGSPFYMAPEVLKRSYGPQADIWSCGVLLYILLCGWPPFYGTTTQQIFRAVLNDPLDLASPPWDRISAQAKDCVRCMLTHSPSRRATVAAVLCHPWMRENGAASDVPLQPEILTRMRQFAGMNRLKKEALRVIASSLPPEEIEGLRSLFCALDTDRSGTISFEELREGLRARGASHLADTELQHIMDECDLDGNQVLEWEEFLTATCWLGKLETRERLLAAFQHFDLDGSGLLSKEEVRQALEKVGRLSITQLESILAEVDRSADKDISIEAFCNMFMSDMTATSGMAPTPQASHEAAWRAAWRDGEGAMRRGSSNPGASRAASRPASLCLAVPEQPPPRRHEERLVAASHAWAAASNGSGGLVGAVNGWAGRADVPVGGVLATLR